MNDDFELDDEDFDEWDDSSQDIYEFILKVKQIGV